MHAIATRLYPDLPRQSLRALAGYLGHGLDLTRRSLGHVEATAFVWCKLCAALEARGKRIARDGGSVGVHWGPGRRLPARLLPGVLRLV